MTFYIAQAEVVCGDLVCSFLRKPHYSHQETVFYEAESLFNILRE